MLLPTTPKVQEYTYLDYNASSPTHPEVLRAIAHATSFAGNPSALHQPGQQLKYILHQARTFLQKFVGAQNAQLIFTSGATESNYWVCHGPWDNIILSPFEHPSVHKNTRHKTCIVDKNGLIDTHHLENILKNSKGKTLVSVQMANSESGLLINTEQVVRIAHTYNAYVHSDATQAFGRIPINFQELGFDAMTIAAHKSGGPKGVGALIIKNLEDLTHHMKGGQQEFGFRAGTENILGIVGFAELCKHINWEHNNMLHQWHTELEQTLAKACPESVILSPQTPRLPNTSLLHMPGVPTTTQTIHFDLKKIAIGAGVSCSSGTSEGIAFLQSLKLPKNIAHESIRVSSGWNTTRKDMDSFAQEWLRLFYH